MTWQELTLTVMYSGVGLVASDGKQEWNSAMLTEADQQLKAALVKCFEGGLFS